MQFLFEENLIFSLNGFIFCSIPNFQESKVEMKKYLLLDLCVCCCALFLLCGCQTPLKETPRNAPWTLTELENRAAGEDPIEPFNRAMFSVQHLLMEYPVDWIGRVYTSILPRPVIKCVNNLCVNLEFPARFVSALLRAEWKGSCHEFLRFLANSTLGIAGLFDVGLHWFDLYSTDSDFGQTFHTWGIDPGCTFMLPFLPRVNVRDTAGFVFDYAFDAKTYIPYSSVVMLNQAIVAQALYHNLVADSADPYKSYREGMVLRRELQNRLWFYRLGDRQQELFAPANGKVKKTPPFKAPRGIRGNWHDLPEFGEFSPVLSTLQVVLWRPEAREDWWYMPLSIFNSDFANRMKRLYVKLPNGGEVTCGFWKAEKIDYSDPCKVQPEPRLVVLLPGVGGTHNGTSVMALAEALNKENCAVLTMDCAFSGSFMEESRSGKLPGNVEFDAQILRSVLEKALQKVEEEELCQELPQLILAGYSFGGLYTLKIAEMEQISPRLHFERYVAINPPVSLEYASKVADTLAASGASWSEKKTFDVLTETAGRVVTASALDTVPGMTSQMALFRPDEEAARFVAGLYFRLPLRHILHNASAERFKIPLKTPYSWWRRNALYQEIDKVGFNEYARNFVAPQFPGKSLEYLYRKGDMRHFRDLKRISGIRVIHAWDDPLLAPEHKHWLDRTFGKKMFWFSRGGHLGNMYMEPVRKKIVEAVLK